MAIIYTCSFDHYGEQEGTSSFGMFDIGGNVHLGDGWVANPSGGANSGGEYSFGTPAWGARAGRRALLNRDARSTTYGTAEGLLLAIPGVSRTRRLVHFAFSYGGSQESSRLDGRIVAFQNSQGVTRARLGMDVSGRLVLTDGIRPEIANVLLTTPSPVVQPHTWFYFSIDITTAGDFDLYVGDILPSNRVMSGAGLAFSGTGDIDVLAFLPYSERLFSGSNPITAVRDIVICDDTGTYNNTLLGECFVSAQEMRMEEPGGGWEANPRQMVAGGVYRTRRAVGSRRSTLRFADHASLEIGASDFTAEGWFRFSSIPGSSDVWNLLAKWATSTANRSWRLVYYGTDKTIRWEASANGSAATTVKQIPFEPILHRWHHIAVVRDGGFTHLYIDGKEYGAGVADSNTYYNGTAYVGVGCRFYSTDNSPVPEEDFDGFIDEVRLTIGVSRYAADFVPSTVPFGRNVTDDPDFASVGLLLGFDNNDNADESSNSFQPLTYTSAPPPPPPLNPEDGDYSFRVLNGAPPIDDTYIEAPYTRATGLFTFNGLPAATETITVGSQVYTWVSALTGADDIMIGATVDDCIDNLVSAMNADAGAGTKYGTGTLANADARADAYLSPQVWFTATVMGAAGNSVATTTTMVDGRWRDATLLGGQDIPGPSEFAIERLPVDVTGILGVQMTTRYYKTDAGTASMRLDLVGPGGAVLQGDDVSPDLNPQWGKQIFEEDPDTGAGITPSTLIGGRVRFTRTA